MCDPITAALLIGGTVASVAGTKIATNEADQNAANMAKARNKVLEQTLARNKAYADDSREIFNKRVADVNDNGAQNIQQSQADRTANIEANIPDAAPADTAAMPSSAPAVVKSDLAKRLADVFRESTDKAKGLGALTGYGGYFQDEAIKDASANRGVGVNADSIAGNMNLLPSLMDYAQIGANKPSSGLGQMLTALGGMASSAAGARGMGGGGMSPATAASLEKAQAGFFNPGVGPGGMGFLRPGGPR